MCTKKKLIFPIFFGKLYIIPFRLVISRKFHQWKIWKMVTVTINKSYLHSVPLPFYFCCITAHIYGGNCFFSDQPPPYQSTVIFRFERFPVFFPDTFLLRFLMFPQRHGFPPLARHAKCTHNARYLSGQGMKFSRFRKGQKKTPSLTA